jgi:hypothetical protein
MYQLTQEEFNDRLRAVQDAMHIFRELTDKNMTNAFIAYQEILAKRTYPVALPVSEFGTRSRNPFDYLERPICPVCGSVMMFRAVPFNPEGVKSQIVCDNPDCDTVLNSENDLQWWTTQLKPRQQ